jgi:glycerol uptake facilitator-like aquaporin
MEIDTKDLKKYFAEYFGTFILTIVVITSIAGDFSVSTAVLAALTLLIFVYSIGSISGSHLNPGVTLGIFSLKKIDAKQALTYLMAQLLGAASAFYLSNLLELSSEITFSSENSALFGEFLGMLIFTFGISAVVHKAVDDEMYGVVIGGSLLIGLAIASLFGAGAFLNPAVMLGLGVSSAVYVFIDLLGAVAGFQLFKLISNKKD